MSGVDDIRPPIEELSDVSWARIERGLLSRIDTTTGTPIVAAPAPRRWIWFAAPTSIAAAVAAVVMVSVAGSSTHEPGGVPSPAEEPMRVVSSDAPSSATFGDAHITIDAHSAIAMKYDGRQPTTLLERGAAQFAVAPRGPRPEFVVRAGDATVRVIGTKFRVARFVAAPGSYGERIDVAVEHGVVEIHYRGTIQQVSAHHGWTSDRPAEVAEIPEVASAHQDLADPSPVDANEPVEIEMPASTAPRKASRPTSSRHTAPALEHERKPAVVGVAPDADRTKFEQLQAIEKRDPSRAIAGYLELSQQSGRWAAVGLYAAGRLAADRHDARAETLLTIYLRRFPSGRNVDDARRILSRLKEEPR